MIIEVKLAENAESRRAVVAQVLSYAGYLQGLDPEQLESRILGRHLETGGSVLAAVQAAGHEDMVDPEDFREGLAHSLAEGSFRLVIVLDSAPDELVQVVGYLQSITDKTGIWWTYSGEGKMWDTLTGGMNIASSLNNGTRLYTDWPPKDWYTWDWEKICANSTCSEIWGYIWYPYNSQSHGISDTAPGS